MGCGGGAGDRCQTRSDCNAGLACVLSGALLDECKMYNPACPPCVAGGFCQVPIATEKRCATNDDCDPGLVCAKSSLCTEQGAMVCTAVSDMGQSD